MSKFILCGLVFLGTFSLCGDVINDTTDKTVVCEMYIKHCQECGYDKMEGYYSYIDKTGYEECKECGYYIEINNN